MLPVRLLRVKMQHLKLQKDTELRWNITCESLKWNFGKLRPLICSD